jgi:TetR/AcrR family transcriptional regulator
VIANGKSSHPSHANGKASNPPKSASAPPAASGKPKRLRKEEIVAEATRLFAERGYEGASMGDLAERVGLRKASLFHHFPSKDVLYSTVLRELLENVKVAILSAALADGSFAERLDALTEGVTDVLSAQPYAARLLVREAMDWGPVMKGGLGRTINDVLAAGLEFAKAGQRAGEFNPDLDASQVLVSFVGIHLMPFAIGEVVEGFTGTSPFHPAFVRDRKVAVRMHIRDLALVKQSKR